MRLKYDVADAITCSKPPMNIDFSCLDYAFLVKPLLVGGKAMEYYQLRNAGADIDFIVHEQDYGRLAEQYPTHIKERFGNFGVCVAGFEFWKSLVLFGYDFLSAGAIEGENFRVISLEKLLFLATLAITKEKHEQDVRLLVSKIHDIQYGRDQDYDTSHFVPIQRHEP